MEMLLESLDGLFVRFNVGERVVLRKGKNGHCGKYNSHIVSTIPDGSIGIVEPNPNDGFPYDATQVFMDGGHGAIESRLLKRSN